MIERSFAGGEKSGSDGQDCWRLCTWTTRDGLRVACLEQPVVGLSHVQLHQARGEIISPSILRNHEMENLSPVQYITIYFCLSNSRISYHAQLHVISMEYLKGITYSINMSGLYQERQTPSDFVVASMTLFAQSAPLFFSHCLQPGQPCQVH